MIVRIKPGVSLDKVHHKMFFAVFCAAVVWEQMGANFIEVTGANEAGHTTNPDKERQFHRLPDGTCQAFDFGIHNLKSEKKPEARRILASMLGSMYDVLLEFVDTKDEHIHVQFDPKRPGTVL